MGKLICPYSVVSMLSDDDFDALYDSYRRKKEREKKQGFATSDLEELPLWKDVKGSGSVQTCTICRKEMNDLDLVEACPKCKNYFHYKHIREWLKIQGKCPICKQ